MKKTTLLTAAVLSLLAVSVHAQFPIDGAHYPVGLEGIRCGSLPEPGIYFSDDNLFYTGTSDLLPDFKTFVYLQAPQLTWMSDWKILGAHYGVDVMVPFIYKQVHYNTTTVVSPSGRAITSSEGGNTSGLGDIEIEPLLLSWHWKQFNVSAGYALWLPTGDYNNSSMVNLGDGRWTHMMTLGGTWYPDARKAWAVSVLNHFEFNSEQPGVNYAYNITPVGAIVSSTTYVNVSSSVYTLEWGISRTFFKKMDVGITGYYQRQFTDQSPAFVVFPNAEAAGIGPAISGRIPRWDLSISLQYAYEFVANNHPQGHVINLALSKRF